MTLVASLLSGLFMYLLVGFMTGHGPRFEMRKAMRPTVSEQQTWLIQAGVQLTPRQFWMTSIGAGALAFAVFLLVSGVPLVALMPAIVVALLPRAYFSRRRIQRLSEVQQAWPDGIRDLVASISSGMSLPKAVEALARSGPIPLRQAFAAYPLLTRTLGVVPALEVIKEELADPTSDRVIEVLILAYERGGALVPRILHDLGEATTRDLWAIEEIRTEALEQKINARVVFALPWFVLVALTARAGLFREFYRSPGGAVVIVIGAAMSLLGIAVVRRLSRDPDEPRVMGGAALLVEQGGAR
ncbi:MAG: type II secretion system F family protein [Acidimicrobiia bacterium]|nr:type II secretion system F family protein [Acidimicrobiia bacterium]